MSLNFHTAILASSRRRGGAFDADAADYFARGEAAGSTMTPANKALVDAFIRGIKDDESVATLATHPIKASCIIGAWDTLAGALVPLVGTAPTNNGPFVTGDYSRTTGLVGNGTSKYLGTSYAPVRNNWHTSIYAHSLASPGIGAANFSCLIGARVIGGAAGSVQIIHVGPGASPPDSIQFLPNSGSYARSQATGFIGMKRSLSTASEDRISGTTSTNTATTDATTATANFDVFRRSNGVYTTSRLRFFSAGESLNLAQLDARLTTLMGALT